MPKNKFAFKIKSFLTKQRLGFFTMSQEFLNPRWALFYGHRNDATERAKTKFITSNGKNCWNKEIQPFVNQGIMSLFNAKPNKWTVEFLKDVCRFVNEKKIETNALRRSTRNDERASSLEKQLDDWFSQIKL